jgi:peptide/nickel transport system ATP-binding protein
MARCFRAEEIDPSAWQPPEGLVTELAPPPETMESPILQIQDLKTYYEQESRSVLSLAGLGRKRYVKAVDDISLAVPRGRTLGVVGESGCGKSTLAKTIVRLESPSGGQVEFPGFDISLPVSKWDLDLVEELQVVFQNPDSTMNPSYTIGHQIARPLRRFRTVPSKRVYDEVVRLLHAVRLNESYYHRLPRQLSGGRNSVSASPVPLPAGPSAPNPPTGCVFHTRCPRRDRVPDGRACEHATPPARHNTDHHRIYCHIPLGLLREFEPMVNTD